MNEFLSQVGMGQIVLAVVAVQMLATLVAVLLCRAGSEQAVEAAADLDAVPAQGLLAA